MEIRGNSYHFICMLHAVHIHKSCKYLGLLTNFHYIFSYVRHINNHFHKTQSQNIIHSFQLQNKVSHASLNIVLSHIEQFTFSSFTFHIYTHISHIASAKFSLTDRVGISKSSSPRELVHHCQIHLTRITIQSHYYLILGSKILILYAHATYAMHEPFLLNSVFLFFADSLLQIRSKTYPLLILWL